MQSQSNRNRIRNPEEYRSMRNQLITLIDTKLPKKANGVSIDWTSSTKIIMFMRGNNQLINYFGIRNPDELENKYSELKNEIIAETYQNQLSGASMSTNTMNRNRISAEIDGLQQLLNKTLRSALNTKQQSDSLKYMLENPELYELTNQQQMNLARQQKTNLNQTSRQLLSNAHRLRTQIQELDNQLDIRRGGSVKRRTTKKRTIKK